MKSVRAYFAWLTSLSLIGAPLGLEGCGSKDKEPAALVQQDASAATPAASANSPAPNQQPDQQGVQQASQQQPADQSQPVQLPDVNLTPAGLDELLAPIALYPDPVLAVILQASVDPQEVMDGGNWLALDQNQNLKDAALDEASKKAGFTPVMQALLHYPTVIDLLCTQFDWTKQLGASYQADPKAVLDSVQRLRAVAVDNGALKTSPQMKVDVKQDQGQQVVEVQPADPKVVYVPQYDPTRVFSTTTTTTNPDGSSTTTTTTSSPAPATSTNSTVVVQQQSGVSTGTAVFASLLSFGAGIAVGMAINSNNYYYPSWGYGGCYYGGRPYYPPPYHPYYGGGWGPSYGYNRPVHYGNNNIYINNSHNNYYNRFNNNNNLHSNYKPMPVHYNNKPNGVYANSMGNKPGANKGVNYNRQNPNYQKPNTRPVNAGNTNNLQRPGGNNAGSNNLQRPGNNAGGAAGGNANNWKGQTTYQGKQPGGANAENRPSTGNVQARPGAGTSTGAAPTRPGGGMNTGGNPQTRPAGGNDKFANKNVDRGYGQSSTGGRQNTSATPSARPSTGNMPANRPSNANTPTSRPSGNTQASRPAPQQTSRPQSNGGGAFGGASSNNASADRAASNRGRTSMGAPQQTSSGASKQQQAAPRKR